MFDAKSLFEQMMQGGNPSAQQNRGGQGDMPDLGDLLRQFTEGGGQGQSGRGAQGGGLGGGMQELPTSNADNTSDNFNRDTGAERGSALDDLMRQFSPGNEAEERSAPSNNGGRSGGGLEDLLREFTQEKRGGGAAAPGAGGGLGDLLGQVFGQGQEAAGKAGQGAQDTMREVLERIGGNGANARDMMGQLTDFIGNNKVGAGAALGGLGALIFGTKTGRSIAAGAAKVGAMAVIGGLAYKAYQNYSQGRPLVSGSIAPEAAPRGTGFEADEVSNDAAVTYIRGMIAAAAADGRIDAQEQEQVIGALSGQGLDAQAEQFLANELNNPASIDDLIDGVRNDTESLQLYTAARVSIEPDTSAEQQFLAVLADRLGITPDLRAHVDAAARGMV